MARRFCLALAPGLFFGLSGAKDPCECLNWKEVYEAQRLLCGEGWEFAFDYPMGPPKTYEFARFAPFTMGFTYHEFCNSFFMRMDNNYCVNIKHHVYGVTGPEADQWCYVSRECNQLNGGKPVPDQLSIPELPQWLLGPTSYQIAKLFHTPQKIKRDLSMKVCKAGSDKFLADLGVMGVMELGKKMDSVIGFVTKTAFPMARRGDATTPHWAEVKDAVEKYELERLPPMIKKAIEAGEPIIIDVDPEGHTHQKILVGKQIYELDNACGPQGCGGLQWPFRKGRLIGEL